MELRRGREMLLTYNFQIVLMNSDFGLAFWVFYACCKKKKFGFLEHGSPSLQEYIVR